MVFDPKDPIRSDVFCRLGFGPGLSACLCVELIRIFVTKENLDFFILRDGDIGFHNSKSRVYYGLQITCTRTAPNADFRFKTRKKRSSTQIRGGCEVEEQLSKTGDCSRST